MSAVEIQELAQLGLRRFTRAEYDRFVELGVFEDEKVELLHGFLVEMSPQGARHAYATRHLQRILMDALSPRAEVHSQSPLALRDDSQPEPDLAVVPLGDYRRAHPTAAQLVVEVADSSQRKERRSKAPLYATAAIPEYWIVLVADGVVEIYREPRDGRYTRMETVDRGGTITMAAFPDVRVRVDDFMP